MNPLGQIFCCVILLAHHKSEGLPTPNGTTEICNPIHENWTCRKEVECLQESQNDKTKWSQSDVCSSDQLCCNKLPIKSNKTGRAIASTVIKSERMCTKYAENVTTLVDSPILLEGAGKILIDNCNIVEEPLIVGGQSAKRKEFPHMAIIGFGNDTHVYWLCGGSLISERYLLTAAHCSDAEDRGEARWAKLGVFTLNSSGDDFEPELFEIVERIVHPDYTRNALYNDIALFKLNREVNFNNYIRPSCINRNHRIAEPAAIATGWGRTQWQGMRSSALKKVKLDLINSAQCNQSLSKKMGPKLSRGIDPETMICAGGVEGNDTCQGDSGGPLQVVLKSPYCMYSIVGVTSFGYECGFGDPAVYTRVSYYASWIESIVWP